jgi:hypothetical protein
MARVLIDRWAGLTWDGTWRQISEFHLTNNGSNWHEQVIVSVGDNDSAAQIKSAVSTAIRAFSQTDPFNCTVESNQIIWPDGTRT